MAQLGSTPPVSVGWGLGGSQGRGERDMPWASSQAHTAPDFARPEQENEGGQVSFSYKDLTSRIRRIKNFPFLFLSSPFFTLSFLFFFPSFFLNQNHNVRES